jgi:hypothetical protein
MRVVETVFTFTFDDFTVLRDFAETTCALPAETLFAVPDE